VGGIVVTLLPERGEILRAGWRRRAFLVLCSGPGRSRGGRRFKRMSHIMPPKGPFAARSKMYVAAMNGDEESLKKHVKPHIVHHSFGRPRFVPLDVTNKPVLLAVNDNPCTEPQPAGGVFA